MSGKENNMKPRRVSNAALGMLDSRTTDNEGLMIRRTRGVSISKLFGNERKAAVAFFMSDLICKGFNDNEICDVVNEKYNLSWQLKEVKVMKSLIHKLWRVQTAAEMNAQIQQEVAAIDVQIRELWRAWEFSKKGISEKTTRSTKSSSGADMMDFDQTETILKEDVSAGDPKYMSLINDLGKEKRKLLGLYAPEKKNTSDMPTAVQINVVGGDGNDTIKTVLETCGRTTIDADAEIIDDNQANKPNKMEKLAIEQHNYENDIEALYEEMMNEDD